MQAATGSTYASSAPALIIADEGPEGRAAEEALALAGGRALDRVDWRDAAEWIGRRGALGVVMVEAERIPDALVEAVLPRLDALARDTDARVVIALADDQIDLVAAHLLGGQADLLCAPSVADRVAALAVALRPRPHGRLHDATRDAEATRLRRLNKEIARIAKILAQLTREDADENAAALSVLSDQPMEEDAPLRTDASPVAARDVREAIRVRRLRDYYFGRGLFEDPAWDMLLDLFAAELEATQVSVSSLCIAAAVAPTTALRWISKMTDAGLFVRQADPFDRRRAFMALSPKAYAGMLGYFTALQRTESPAA